MENRDNVKCYFDFTKVFTKTKNYIDIHNNKHEELKKRLNANHRATAELITRLYAKQLNRAVSLGKDIKTQLPGFKTFNPSLATCKGCTTRTIINHKERLKAAGFIIKEIHRGKAGIELWINPLIFDDRVKNLHPLVHEQQEQNNNNSSVDKLITSEKEGVRYEAHKQSNNCVTRTAHEQYMNTEESRISDSENQTWRKKKSSVRESESAFLLHLVLAFWSYARAALYKDLIFCEAEKNEILNNIWASIYKKFRVEGSKKDWENHQIILYKRIDMVSRWLKRNPNRWIPAPHLYFHPENTRNDFRKTHKWYVKQETLKRNIRNQILIQKIEAEWKDHVKSIYKNKAKTGLQLFRLQQQRISVYKDEALIRAFEQSLQRTVLNKFTS